MWPLFLGTETPAPLMLPDSVQKAHFAETVHKIANLDFETVLAEPPLRVGLDTAENPPRAGDLFRRPLDPAAHRQAARPGAGTPPCRYFAAVVHAQHRARDLHAAAGADRRLDAGRQRHVAHRRLLRRHAGHRYGPERNGPELRGRRDDPAHETLPCRRLHLGTGAVGTVREIKLFSTVITTADNQTIYIPNNSIATAIIDNYSTSDTRRVDWTIGISYGDDVDTARAAILAILAADNRVLGDPAPWCGSRPLPTARSTSLREPG